jgi:hypothetical protein
VGRLCGLWICGSWVGLNRDMCISVKYGLCQRYGVVIKWWKGVAKLGIEVAKRWGLLKKRALIFRKGDGLANWRLGVAVWVISIADPHSFFVDPDPGKNLNADWGLGIRIHELG